MFSVCTLVIVDLETTVEVGVRITVPVRLSVLVLKTSVVSDWILVMVVVELTLEVGKLVTS